MIKYLEEIVDVFEVIEEVGMILILFCYFMEVDVVAGEKFWLVDYLN